MDDIRRHMPITEPTTIMLESSYSDKDLSLVGSSSSLPILTMNVTAELEHQQRPSISSMIDPPPLTHRPQADRGLYERVPNQAIPHVRMEMPIPTIKIKNRPFSPDAIRRLISMKRSHLNGGKRPWADRTHSEPTLTAAGGHVHASGTANGTGTVGQENRSTGLEASGQLKSLHFDDLGLDFDDFDWAQFGVGTEGGMGQTHARVQGQVEETGGSEVGTRRGKYI